MADQDLSLSIKVNTETGAIDVLGAKLKGLADAGKTTQSSFGNLSGGAKDLLGAFGLVATGAGIVEFFKKAVTEANADAEALRRLQFTLEANGSSWAANKANILAWSEGLQESTRFSNTEALEGLAKLSKATHDVGQAQQGVKLAMDLSVASGMDFAQSLEMINGLMVGNQRSVMMAHRELGTFVGTASTAQGMLDALSSKVQGAAAHEESFSKASAQMSNAWDDFAKQVGNAFIPALTGILQALTWVTERVENLGTVISAFVVSAAEMFVGLGKALGDALIGHFSEAVAEIRGTTAAINAIVEGTVDSFKAVEDKKTNALNVANQARTRLIAGASLQDAKQKLDEANKFIQIETELAKKVDALGQQTLAKKIDALNQEVEAKRSQINKEIENEAKKAQLLVDLERWKSLSVIDLNRQESQRKIDASFQVANIAVQTLQTINSMSNQDSEAEKARAIALLALQQAIAIGWAWVHAVRIGGPFAPAIAAAETALLVAQFASQVQAIEKSSASANTQVSSVAINSVQLPGGGAIVNTVGSGLDGSLQGIPVSVTGTQETGSVAALGSAAATSGGSGVTVNVTVQAITINVQVDTLEVADRRRILQALTDELRTATVDAIRFAVTSSNLASTNSQVAV